jgi:4-hydroxy-tetrahydrodipicolinate synthase
MKKLNGVTVAMVTPFNENGEVNLEAVRNLSSFLIDKGVDALFPLGTTGEMYRLSIAERKEIAETVLKGAMRMDETIELSQHAEKIGADGIGVVTPSYFNVNDRELEEYYTAVAESVSENFPVYLYNIPQCSANDLSAEVAEKLYQKHSNIVGIKYSYPDIMKTNKYLEIGDGQFSVMHGTDKLMHTLLTLGCAGVVSGISSVYPEPFVALYQAYQNNDQEKILKVKKIAGKFVETLKAGTNLAYFKAALNRRGIKAGYMRRPQLELTAAEKEELYANLDILEDQLKLL